MEEFWTILITFEDGYTIETTCPAIYQISDAILDAVANDLKTTHGAISEIKAY